MLTTSDLNSIREIVKNEVGDAVDSSEKRLRGEMQDIEGNLRGEINSLRIDTAKGLAEFGGKLQATEQRLIRKIDNMAKQIYIDIESLMN